MSDSVDTPEDRSPADERRAALLAQVNAGVPTGPANPYALAIGWIAGILMAVGVLIVLIGLSDGYLTVAAAVTGAGFAGFGLVALLLLLGIQAARWTPPRHQDDAPKS